MIKSSADKRRSVKLDREKKFENLDNNNISGCTLARTKVRLEIKRFQISGIISGTLVLLSLQSPLSASHGLTEWLLVFLLCKYDPRLQTGYQTEWGLQSSQEITFSEQQLSFCALEVSRFFPIC